MPTTTIDSLPLALQDRAREVAAEIEAELEVEREGWAPRMVAAVYRRFADAGVPLALRSRVVWASSPQAVTLIDGRTYVSREILSRGVSEAGLAFVLAHEQAHHDLGHFAGVVHWADRLDGIPGAVTVAGLLLAITRNTQRAELEADAHAFARCRRAGYDLDDVLSFFRMMERYYLDHRAFSAVWKGPFVSRAKHPPVETRVGALRDLAGGDELPIISVSRPALGAVPYRSANRPARVVAPVHRVRDRMSATIEHARMKRMRLARRARRRRVSLAVLSVLCLVLAASAAGSMIANPQAWVAAVAFSLTIAALMLGTVALGTRIPPRSGDAVGSSELPGPDS
jgi:hypothetical protein